MNLSIFVIDFQIKNLGKTIQKKTVIFFLCLLAIYPLSLAWAKPAKSTTAKRALLTGTDADIGEGMDLIQERLIDSPSPALPSADFNPADPAPVPSANFAPSMLKAGFSLTLVLALIWAAAWLMKKYYLKGNLPGGKFIRLIDTCSLGPKKSLALIRVENQTLLLGVTGQQIILLSQMEPSEKQGEKKGKTKAPENFAEQLSLNSLKLQSPLPGTPIPGTPVPGTPVPGTPASDSASIAGILESRFKGLKRI